MKKGKLLIAVLIALVGLILAACGSSQSDISDNMNEDIYSAGKQAIRIVESYDSGESTIEECFNEFAPLLEYIETIEVTEDQAESANAVKECINNLAYDLTLSEDYEKDLTELKSILGV